MSTKKPIFYYCLTLILLYPCFSFSQENIYRIVDKNGWIHSKKLKSGVHIGAIGAGKFELFTDGTIGHYTLNNNWDRPFSGLNGIFSAVFVEDRGKKTTKVLQLKSGADLPGVDSILYKGTIPTADLVFKDAEIPVDIELTAFSPLIPGEYIISSLPVAVFRYKLKNPLDRKVKVSVMLSWENLIGVGGDVNNIWDDRTGNFQEIYKKDGLKGLYFRSENKNDRSQKQNCQGEYILLCSGEGIRDKDISVYTSWNVLEGREKIWNVFSDKGEFDNKESRRTGKTGEYHPAGAVSAKVELKKGEEREVVFIFSWYMPHHFNANLEDNGHYYQNYFSSAFDIAKYAANNYGNLLNKVRSWQDYINDSDLPEWLKFKLLNDIYPIYSNSVYTKDGVFATLESPVSMVGALGTIDQRFSAHAFYTACFPKLDESELRLFAEKQLETGEIPHFSGNVRDSKLSAGLAGHGKALSDPLSACAM